MNKKKIVAIMAAAALAAGTTSMAATVSVDDAVITDTAYSAGETLMIPLRTVAESLGYEVNWEAETQGITLTKGVHYITMNIGVDGYTFARTAPMPLGAAPVLSAEGITFVPANILSEVMQQTYEAKEDGIVISTAVAEEKTEETTEETAEQVAGIATVTGISETTITVNDNVLGEVILNIAEETEILNADGEKATIADLSEGDLLEITYSDVMTLSLPPQNTPVKIQLFVIETAETEGVIRGFEDGKILIGGEAPTEQTALVISESTVITDAEGKEIKVEDLKEGVEIKAVHSAASTFSIPPQTAAYEITVK